jgi:hypothetical protein
MTAFASRSTTLQDNSIACKAVELENGQDPWLQLIDVTRQNPFVVLDGSLPRQTDDELRKRVMGGE